MFTVLAFILLSGALAFALIALHFQKLFNRELKFQAENHEDNAIWALKELSHAQLDFVKMRNEVERYKSAFEDANTSLNLLLQESLDEKPLPISLTKGIPQSREVIEYEISLHPKKEELETAEVTAQLPLYEACNHEPDDTVSYIYDPNYIA